MISIHIQKKISSVCSRNLPKIASHKDAVSQHTNLYCNAYIQYRIQSYKAVWWWGVTISHYFYKFSGLQGICNSLQY